MQKISNDHDLKGTCSLLITRSQDDYIIPTRQNIEINIILQFRRC